MHVSRLVLSLGAIVLFLTGCSPERGINLPPPKVKPKPTTKTNEYDFPLIKLIARALPFSKESDTNVSVNSVNSARLEKQKLRKKELETTPSDIAFPTRTITSTRSTKKSPVVTNRLDKLSKKSISTKKRPTKQRSKLIFNKNTSFRDIPLPLPKLSSLKLTSLIKSLPTIPLRKIPILNSLLPEGSKIAKDRLKRKKLSIVSTTNTSPHSSDNTLDMANIRIGVSNDYTALIFDSYLWAGYNNTPTEISDRSGKYEFDYDENKNQIVVRIEGYSAFSALLGDQSELFKESVLVKNIYIDRYIGEKSIQFIIKLKKKVKITVVNMKDPGRIIVNLYPAN